MEKAHTHYDAPSTVWDEERVALLALHFVQGLGGFLIRQLVGYCGSAQNVFKSRPGKLLAIPHIGKTLARAIRTADGWERAEREWRRAEKLGVRILFFNDADFPARLNAFDESPSMLYLQGNADLNTKRTVGIVGTRQATAYGKEQVEQLVEELAAYGPLVVSGLAYGIDIHAHREALNRGLETLGVMGSGIDVVYPSAHEGTAKRMLERGGLITENPLGSKPEAHHFPVRNRIIAALSDALIVVETAEKGGAIITAEMSNEYNKDVFAVPGSVGKPYSAGCHKLIKTHKAHLITHTDDLAYIIGWETLADTHAQTEKRDIDLSSFDGDEKAVIALLDEKGTAMRIDELLRKLTLTPSGLAAVLLNLELNNEIRSLPGNSYALRCYDS